MSLAKLVISNVRNITEARITPSPGINLITGENASGKSALLESIHLLGRATSFRTPRLKEVVQFNAQSLVVSGHSLQHDGSQFKLGVAVDKQGLQIKIDGDSGCSRSALAYSLPIQLVHPGSHVLLEGGPQNRREFMDWGLFHFNPKYLDIWRRCRRALKQRNHLLRENQPLGLDQWDHELSEYGTIVADERQRYLDLLAPNFERVANHFFGEHQLKLEHSQGWETGKDLAAVLRQDRERDLRFGFTQGGPHKGDFKIRSDGKPVASYFSRGQVKLIVFVLKLAQYALLRESLGKTGCMLIDDFAAELDQQNRTKLLAFLAGFDSQFFVTGLSPDVFGQTADLADCSLFHVSSGCISQA